MTQDPLVVFKALCDDKRLRILELLRNGEKCACHITDELDIAQSCLSYHMKVLCESGLIKSRHDGKWTYYKIDLEGSKNAQDLLKEITTIKPGREHIRCVCD
ncbi:MAG: transcriptional regulator [Treponema sp. CETP13]|nr:MAG: transcriptional regulator [Treponema sp. CETP13]